MGSRAVVRRTKAGRRAQAEEIQESMGQFFYVYILQSEADPTRFYTGLTEDLRARLIAHNRGSNPHTAEFRPWQIKTAIAFTNHQQARDFERYLKTASGRAFARKRL
jgi:predicted GIY-YIG superfamily endonuclease